MFQSNAKPARHTYYQQGTVKSFHNLTTEIESIKMCCYDPKLRNRLEYLDCMVMICGQVAHQCPQSWRRFAAQAKLTRFENAGASVFHTPLPFGFNPGDATGTQGIGV